jgi:hypothetical protein
MAAENKLPTSRLHNRKRSLLRADPLRTSAGGLVCFTKTQKFRQYSAAMRD